RRVYPLHRTSLWTRIYAQTQSSRFEAWPRSWASGSPAVRDLTRALLVLGLVPTAIFFLGFNSALRGLVAVKRPVIAAPDLVGGVDESWAAVVLLLTAAVGYTAFAAAYALRLRDYSSMKQIFLLPGLIAFAAVFAEGAARTFGRRSTARATRRLVT